MSHAGKGYKRVNSVTDSYVVKSEFESGISNEINKKLFVWELVNYDLKLQL